MKIEVKNFNRKLKNILLFYSQKKILRCFIIRVFNLKFQSGHQSPFQTTGTASCVDYLTKAIIIITH